MDLLPKRFLSPYNSPVVGRYRCTHYRLLERIYGPFRAMFRVHLNGA